MANNELRLLAKILEVQELRPIQEAGIDLDSFATDEGRQIFNTIRDYYRNRETYGQVPSRAYVEEMNPTIPLPAKEKTKLEAMIAEFKNYELSYKLSELGTFILDYHKDPDEVLGHLSKELRKLVRIKRTSEDHVLTDSLEEVWNRYETRRDKKGYLGIPYPWRLFNEKTGGLLDSEFVVLYGRPKSMKTWVLLTVACHAYDTGNRRVLVATREMKPSQILDRCMCILIGAPYTAFQQGKLHEIPTPEGGTMEDRLIDLRRNMKSDEETCRLESGFGKSLIITSDRADPKGGGVMGLRQKMEDHKPDLLCVDAMYLMKNDRANKRSIKWDDQAAISQDMKELALDFNKPVVGTNQAKRDSEERSGKSVSNISFSDSYGMDCDMAIEIIKKSTRDPEVNELALAITASREINMTGFAIHGNAATSFGSLMTKKRDAEGLIELDERAKPILVPVEFQEYRDLKEFFKDSQDPDQSVPRGDRAAAAAANFREARKGRSN